jgi:hypothetical protein
MSALEAKIKALEEAQAQTTQACRTHAPKSTR